MRSSHIDIIRRTWVAGILAALCLIGPGLPSGLRAKTVTDQLGRSIRVPETPRRVVSLAPNITEIVYLIGRQDLLVGVSRFSDYPEAAQELPKVGSYVQLDLERIVALQPDLCIAIKDGNPKETVDRLEGLGIPVYAVNPQRLASVLETIRELGRLLNAEDHAGELASHLETRIHRIDRLVSQSQERPGIFFQIGVAPIVSAGSNTFLHEIIERAGARNLAGDAGGYPQFSREQVIGLSPEVIIITSMARKEVFQTVRDDWLSWKSIPAARSRRVYIQDSNFLDRPGPRLVDGLELLVKLIHPELFRDVP